MRPSILLTIKFPVLIRCVYNNSIKSGPIPGAHIDNSVVAKLGRKKENTQNHFQNNHDRP